ncbi:MAG: phosphatidylserine decarboxylase [Oscillospiraceae bacterium]|nr:phosphatidylserine decarboxylase [Oscillospiraceae bacterium]
MCNINDANWIYNRGNYEPENICAEGLLRFIYENPVGGASLSHLIKRKSLSRLYGHYCNTGFSARKIPQFIRRYNIDMRGCKWDYDSFTDFFTREKSGIAFPAEHRVLGSPCEGLATVFADLNSDFVIAAKGSYFTLRELFGSEKLAAAYNGGTMLKIRLAPANYHRMHFFDDGKIITSKLINGDLHSVNPIAVKQIARLYCQNKRALILYKTRNFGSVAIVEVGATFVGSIAHCFKNGDKVRRGQCGSYFKPGGSLILVFFQEGRFTPANPLTEQSRKGFESVVGVGEILGV